VRVLALYFDENMGRQFLKKRKAMPEATLGVHNRTMPRTLLFGLNLVFFLDIVMMPISFMWLAEDGMRLGMVAYACNSSDSRGGDQETARPHLNQ
jgi:hypothetical protein